MDEELRIAHDYLRDAFSAHCEADGQDPLRWRECNELAKRMCAILAARGVPCRGCFGILPLVGPLDHSHPHEVTAYYHVVVLLSDGRVFDPKFGDVFASVFAFGELWTQTVVQVMLDGVIVRRPWNPRSGINPIPP